MPKNITHGWTTALPDDPDYDVSADELNDHAEVYSGLTAGQVLRASSATAADFAALQDGDIPATIARDSEVAVVGAWASRAATFLVAASDASQAMQDAADYLCDGTADDVQINAALAALPAEGGKVVLSEGTFTVAGTIDLPTNAYLGGQGAATQIVLANGANANVIQNTASAMDIGIADLTINGNRANNTSGTWAGIAFVNATRFRVSGVRVVDPRGYGISANGCTDGIIQDCIASGAGNDNFIAFDGSTRITFSDCRGSGSVGDLGGGETTTGFEVGNDCTEITLNNCIAYDNAHNGFSIHNHTGAVGPFHVALNNCIAYDNAQHGFDVIGQAADGPSGIVLTGCVAYSNTLDGFDVREISGTTGSVELVGCIARSNARFGFQIIGPDDVILSGCTAISNTNHGFITFDAGSEGAVFNGCESIANGGTGYYLVGNDATLTGCVARANTGAMGASSGSGFQVQGTGVSLNGCRSMDHAEASNGRGFYVLAASCQLVGCTATGNVRDGLLILATTRTGVIGGRYANNTLNGIRSTAGSDFLRIIGVEATGNSATPQISLHADGVNNIVEADASLAPTHDHDADYEAAGGIATHAADSTAVHGITDTSALYTVGGADVAVADGGTGASTAAVARANLDLEAGTDFPSLATFNDHSARHENGGADVISIAGLAGTPTELTNHLGDASDAHDASAVSLLDAAAKYAATDVEAAFAELRTDRPVDLSVGSFPVDLMNIAGVVFTITNGAFRMAFQVYRPVSVSTAYFRVAVASGNMDIGIYEDGSPMTRLGSTGSFAVPAAAVTCSRALTGSVNLVPGKKYIASVACDNTTASFGAFNGAGAPTVPGYNKRDAVGSSMPLPATMVAQANNTGIHYGIWFA